jgi:hypothetical protein
MPSALQPGDPLRRRRTFRQDDLDQRFAQKLDAGVELTVVHDSVFYVSRRINHSERRQNFADRSASLRPARRHVSRACRRPHQRPQTWPLIWRAALRRSPSPITRSRILWNENLVQSVAICGMSLKAIYPWSSFAEPPAREPVAEGAVVSRHIFLGRKRVHANEPLHHPLS